MSLDYIVQVAGFNKPLKSLVFDKLASLGSRCSLKIYIKIII